MIEKNGVTLTFSIASHQCVSDSRCRLHVGLMVTSTCFGEGSQALQTLPAFDSAQALLFWAGINDPFCLACRLAALGRKYLFSCAVTLWLQFAAGSGHPGRRFCSGCYRSPLACLIPVRLASRHSPHWKRTSLKDNTTPFYVGVAWWSSSSPGHCALMQRFSLR